MMVSILSLKESDIEKYLVEKARRRDCLVRKVKWSGANSAPDRVLMGEWERLAYGTVIWVEVKAPGGALTFPKNAHERAQFREHKRMRDAGQVVCVVDSFESVDELFA